jgi:hypothetical protein
MIKNKIRIKGKSASFISKRGFLSAGWGKYGPYFVGTFKPQRKIIFKATAGTKGLTLGARYIHSKKMSIEGHYNIITHRPSFGIKFRKGRTRYLI